MITVVSKRAGAQGEYIGRGSSPLGNPYIMHTESQRDEVCDQYLDWLNQHLMAGTPAITNELIRLADLARAGDLALVCWCAPRRCHGDIIKEVLEELLAVT